MNLKTISVIGIISILVVTLIVGITLFTIGSQLLDSLSEKKCIAEIYLKGPIIDENNDEGGFLAPEPPPTGHEIAELIKKADEDKNVGAIVIYINSPGGEVIPSREIYEALKNASKPTVSYIRAYGTSGAYYAAVGTDYIIAEPEAFTANIGVRATFISMQTLFENLGIKYETIKTGDKKDMGDIGKNLSEEERKLMGSMIMKIFGEFKNAVITNRGTIPEEVFDGRIILGMDAVKYNIIDQTGNEEDAFKKAAELAGIKDYKKCKYDKDNKSFMEEFMNSIQKPIKIKINLNTPLNSQERMEIENLKIKLN